MDQMTRPDPLRVLMRTMRSESANVTRKASWHGTITCACVISGYKLRLLGVQQLCFCK
jgi:hypothetical protein